MAGRYKIGADGQRQWEELAPGVTAPDQVAGPAQSSTPSTPSPPSQGSFPTLPPGAIGENYQKPGGDWRYGGGVSAQPNTPDNPTDPYGRKPGKPGESNADDRTKLTVDPLLSTLMSMQWQQYQGAMPGGGNAYTPEQAPGAATPPSVSRQATQADVSGDAPRQNGATAAAGTNRPAPPGFQGDRWNDPNLQDNKYRIGRMVDQMIGQGATNADIMAAVIAANPGTRQSGSDSIVFPDGVVEDLIFDSDNASGQRRAQYTETGGRTDSSSGQAAAPGQHGLPPGARTTSAPTGPGISAAPGAAPDTRGLTPEQSMMVSRPATQADVTGDAPRQNGATAAALPPANTQPPGQAGHQGAGDQFGGGVMGNALAGMFADGMSAQGGDPITGIMRSARTQGDIATRQARGALAERSAQEGTNPGGAGSGYFDSAIQGQIEDQGRNLSGMEANLRYQELNNKRQELVQAISLAQGQERINLQAQLQQMNNEMSRLQLSQQNSQFYDTMGYNMGRDQSDNDFRYLQMLMQGGGA